jgi:glutathione synthase/RimK-type ligase-like ATP-grasp enzyme
LSQESVLRNFNPDTINTIRVLTKNVGGNIQIVSAAVRFGRRGQFVDNMHAGGLAASVDVETGKINSHAGRRFDPIKYVEHPDSHLTFEGVQIPQWQEIKQLVFHTLTLLPPYFSVGFDIVTTDNGPLVLEINTGAGMDLAQVGKDWGIADAFYSMPQKCI